MSTHKWLSNVKTCGVVIFRDPAGAPAPPNISFGWEPAQQAELTVERVRYCQHFNLYSSTSEYNVYRRRFQWLGMGDYVPYITLAKAVKIFAKYGEAQLQVHRIALIQTVQCTVLQLASNILERGIAEVLHLKPLLAKTYNARVINTVELENIQFGGLGDLTEIQNALQDHGIHVSVKR